MKISKKKKEQISKQILDFLYSKFPEPIFTSKIAEELARDEEFIKRILKELEEKKLTKKIILNSKGRKYIKRRRWTLSDKVYKFYKNNF